MSAVLYMLPYFAGNNSAMVFYGSMAAGNTSLVCHDATNWLGGASRGKPIGASD